MLAAICYWFLTQGVYYFSCVSGALDALDELLVKKNQVGEWVYKEEHDHQLVSAVCIQIKGDIQFNLGQWLQGAKLLLESLILFRYGQR